MAEDRVWLIRAMCHVDAGCDCADRGGIVDDYNMCRIISRHANAIIKARAASSDSRLPTEPK